VSGDELRYDVLHWIAELEQCNWCAACYVVICVRVRHKRARSAARPGRVLVAGGPVAATSSAGSRRKSGWKSMGNRGNFRGAENGFPRVGTPGNRDWGSGKSGRIAYMRKTGNREIAGLQQMLLARAWPAGRVSRACSSSAHIYTTSGVLLATDLVLLGCLDTLLGSWCHSRCSGRLYHLSGCCSNAPLHL
jgi:hypothetical protein